MVSREIQNLKIAALLLLLLAVAGKNAAQSASQTPAMAPLKVKSSLVLIPTVVTDAKGNAIEDMKKEDFVVLEDGQRQEIAIFEHVQTKGEVMKVPATPDGVYTNQVEGGTNRLTIFVLDFYNTSIHEQQTAREQLLTFLSRTLNVREPVCLVALDADGLKIIHDFTTDPSVLLEALKNVKIQGQGNDKAPYNSLDENFRMIQGWNSRSGSRSLAMTQARLNFLRLAEAEAQIGARIRIQQTLEALRQIGEAFIGIPGRKSLIWATGGFPFDMDDPSRFGVHDRDLLPAYDRTWRALNEANVAVYPLDVGDLVNPGYVAPSMGRALPQHVHLDISVSKMENFASVTGGKFCNRGKDAQTCFEQATKDSSDYYLIGIYDKNGEKKPGWRKLSVRSYRNGLQIRSRNGYFVNGSVEPKSDRQEMESALASPFNYTSLPVTIRLTAIAPGEAPGKKQVGFIYTLPSATATVDEADKNHLNLGFAALAVSTKGKPAATFSQGIEGHLPQAKAEEIRAQGIVFTGTMDLEPGNYTLNFVVRDNLNGNIGTVTAPVKVE